MGLFVSCEGCKSRRRPDGSPLPQVVGWRDGKALRNLCCVPGGLRQQFTDVVRSELLEKNAATLWIVWHGPRSIRCFTTSLSV